MNGRDIVQDYSWTETTVRMGFAAFSTLIWDHLITFGDEVELVWKRRHGLFTYLFFLNRYLTPLGFIINLFAYLSPSWTHEYLRCERFVRYEGSMTVIGISVTALMMMLRIRAIYSGRPYVVAGVVLVLFVNIGVNAWLLTKGTGTVQRYRPFMIVDTNAGLAVVHESRHIHSCTMIFDPSIGWVASASAWLPLLYDSIILALTFFRTYSPMRRKEGGQLFKRLLEDGILYYSVIFSVTLILTIMIVVAQPGLKNLMAQFELL
ncbi:hypothetical protein NEOLEDRAFT_1175645 [Neolentinus lepideus HHB14362 ss-1]|uniref:DUF6533 domain-containing protein n=1 Tax=Neolentinus lepideus HHB14362 ss-1 TaxID=1314782 RepID=A0A165UWP3_9AGAM|nr:hypothetical protein NEOLEDRAFT_1175645 [Neolentinus lepideus HHB14362 ss-1]